MLQDASDEMCVAESFMLIEAGILPAAGGWSDQTAQWTSAINICSRYFQECRQFQMDESQKKAMEKAKQSKPGGHGRRGKR